MKRILIVMVTLSSAAAAQTSTTNCTTSYPGNVQCTTQQQPSGRLDPSLMTSPSNAGNSAMDAYQRGLRERQARETARQKAQAAEQAAQAARAQTEALQSRQQADELHRTQSLEAGKIVSAGDCARGQQYALSVGNFVLAQQIKELRKVIHPQPQVDFSGPL